MRAGEVLETVPGVVISQHSGEGKANQYYLRGFNLDHGTDFATTVAGMPVNMPTHGHGQGYSDLNFLIPELVSGVQYSKGPYSQTRETSRPPDRPTSTTRACSTRRSCARPAAAKGFGRAMVAASPLVGVGHLLAALEVEHNDGPWVSPDKYEKVNGVPSLQPRRHGQRVVDHRHGLSRDVERHRSGAAARDRRGDHQPVRRAGPDRRRQHVPLQRDDGVAANRRTTRPPRSSRTGSATTSICFRTSPSSSTIRCTAINSIRRITGSSREPRRLTNGSNRWGDRQMQNRVGAAAAQRRHHDRRSVSPRRAGAPRRRPPGRRARDERRRVRAERDCVDAVAANAGRPARRRPIASAWMPGIRNTAAPPRAGIVSPKGGAVIGPFKGTELYVNAGLGFTATTRAERRSRAIR